MAESFCSLPAHYFDGRSARSWAVALSCVDGALQVRGEGVERDEPVPGLRVSEPMGNAPRLITFPDGAHCEVHDLRALDALLRTTGHTDSLVVSWQFSWLAVIVAMVMVAGVLAAAQQWLVPWLAREVAVRVPAAVLVRISDETLRTLDGTVLRPSGTPAGRREALARRCAALTGDAALLTIVHRQGGRLGANALALPSGSVVLTDELLALVDDEDAVMGVLAHELGHVRLRHGMRMALESSVSGLLLAWYVGDVGSVVAGIPAALIHARYSRALEAEADDFAAVFLTARGIPASSLADALERIDASRESPAGRGMQRYFDSHPETRLRINRLRGLSAGQ